jgi:hypothetical protein
MLINLTLILLKRKTHNLPISNLVGNLTKSSPPIIVPVPVLSSPPPPPPANPVSAPVQVPPPGAVQQPPPSPSLIPFQPTLKLSH